jgi:hypothetical protein
LFELSPSGATSVAAGGTAANARLDTMSNKNATEHLIEVIGSPTF